MRSVSLVLVGLLLAMVIGCGNKSPSEATEIPEEAQMLLDELNALPPETASHYSCPTNEGVISKGGIVPWIADHKQKLEDLGFEVRWNCGELQYEIVPEEESASSICDCPRATENP